MTKCGDRLVYVDMVTNTVDREIFGDRLLSLLEAMYQESQEASGSADLARCGTVRRPCIMLEKRVACLRELVFTVIYSARQVQLYDPIVCICEYLVSLFCHCCCVLHTCVQ